MDLYKIHSKRAITRKRNEVIKTLGIDVDTYNTMKFDLAYTILGEEKAKDYSKSFMFWNWWTQIYHQHDMIFIWRTKNTKGWGKASKEDKIHCYVENHKEYGIYIPQTILKEIEFNVEVYKRNLEHKKRSKTPV